MADVRWLMCCEMEDVYKMDDVLRDVRCMMAEGKCIISLFHSHLISCICAQVPSPTLHNR